MVHPGAHCEICQTCKVSQQKPAGLMGQRCTQEPWVFVAMDIMGPFPPSKSNCRYLLVCQDIFSKMIELAPLHKADSRNILSCFEDLVIHRYGTPEVLLTDNGTEFSNSKTKELAVSLGLKHMTTPPYHAQANPVERVNRVLKGMIICFIGQDHREWDRHLSEFRFAYNTAHHTSLHMTPAFLNYGRQPRASLFFKKLFDEEGEIPVPDTKAWANRMQRMAELYDLVIENLNKAFQTQAKYYNTHHREVYFEIGDKVRRKIRQLSNASKGLAAKLFRKYSTEVYRVSRIVSPYIYEVENEQGVVVGRHHVKDLLEVRNRTDKDTILLDDDE